MSLLRTLVPHPVRREIILNTLLKPTAGRVSGGPFKGMDYGSASTGGMFYCKLLGTYERELNAYIERVISASPSHIIDVGAAEGYYAVGLAMRLQSTRVLAFEMSETGRRLLDAMIARNRVQGRVDVRGRCEPDDLRVALQQHPGAYVICDVEGYETTLLDPVAVPELRNVPMLVELHDIMSEGITETLRGRFEVTHDLTVIPAEPRRATEYPIRNLWSTLLPASGKVRLMHERPPGMSWLWAVPRC